MIEIKTFVIANLIGGFTRVIYSFSKGKPLRIIALNFLLSVLTLFPAYIIVMALNLSSIYALAIGYMFGIIGEKFVEYILNKYELFIDLTIKK